MFDFDKCPHCGSERGYQMSETVRRYLYFTFDDEPNGCSEDMNVYSGITKRCIDCNKLIKDVR